jgi:hypothetical protein
MRRDLTTLGVANPFALAEQIHGRRINWAAMPDPVRTLETILGIPRKRLFDPSAKSPIYRGFELQRDFSIRRLPAERLKADAVERLAQIRPAAPAPMVASEPRVIVPSVILPGLPSTPLSVPTFPATSGLLRHNRVLLAAIERLLADDEQSDLPEVAWVDPGAFFDGRGAPEFSDPVQGNLGDCYLIAALSAVAWARPQMIRARFEELSGGTDVDTVVFRPEGRRPAAIRVSERVPLLEPAQEVALYASSSDAGEIWPAIYEKAFAKWKTGARGDRPNYEAIAGGDCVMASAELTGLSRAYFGTEDLSSRGILNVVKDHSRGTITFDPMTAWTYASNESAPRPLDYDSVQIAANHCYTILGWLHHDGKDYLILRNPWGLYEPTVGVLPSAVWAPRIGSVEPTRLSADDGTFALRVEVFKRYFEGLGVVS